MNIENNVVRMNLDASYVSPDMNQMSSSLDAMALSSAVATVAFLKANYLPSLYAKTTRWTRGAVEGRQVLGESCKRVAINLEQQITKLRNLEIEFAGATDADDLEDIRDERSEVVKRAVDTTQTEINKLSSVLSNVSDPFDAQVTQGYITGFEDDGLRLSAEIARLEENRTNVEAQRKTITDAISALETVGLTAIGEDAILTAEKVIALGAQPPQLAVIQLAFEQIKKTLEDTKATLSFLTLVKERDALREKSNQVSKSINALLASNTQRIERINFIGAVHAVNAQRTVYTTELGKVVMSFNTFIKTVKNPSGTDIEREHHFINNALQLVNYLKPIR
jgi:seryl-tRNA synthetase